MRIRIRIRIKVKSWIRVRITVKRIHNSALNVHELYTVVQKTKFPRRPEREFDEGRPCLAADPWSSQTPPPEETWTSAGSQWCPLTIVNFFLYVIIGFTVYLRTVFSGLVLKTFFVTSDYEICCSKNPLKNETCMGLLMKNRVLKVPFRINLSCWFSGSGTKSAFRISDPDIPYVFKLDSNSNK